jgi:hypothetical protein
MRNIKNQKFVIALMLVALVSSMAFGQGGMAPQAPAQGHSSEGQSAG